MLRILHILSTPRAEGTPNLVLDWLATEKHEQEVFVLNSTPADLAARLRSGSRWYAEADLFQGRGPRKFLRIVQAVHRVCAERRPDLIVCWPTGFANWVTIGARLALGTKAELLVHCGNPPNRGAKADWLTRFVLLPVWLGRVRCVCCSDYVRNAFRAVPGIPGALFTTVHNCARVEEVRQRAKCARAARIKSDSEFAALMVATLERHKDHATLLRAMPTVLESFPAFRLRLAGDGSLRGELQQLAHNLGIASAVEFLGTRRDVPELLGQSDLFILSTTSQEGLGTVLIEALAANLKIVASDVPACREVLAGGRYGVLVPTGQPQALAAAITGAIAIGCESSESVHSDYLQGFTPAKMLEQYLALAGERCMR